MLKRRHTDMIMHTRSSKLKGVKMLYGRIYSKLIPVLCTLQLSLLFLLNPFELQAQSLMPGDPLEYYLRWVAEDHDQTLESSQLIRPLQFSNKSEQFTFPDRHPWSERSIFRILGQDSVENNRSDWMLFSPVLRTTLNTDFPFGVNDGPLWQGRGVNGAFSAGAGFRHRYFEAAFRPVIHYSENRAFELSHVSPYNGLSDFAMALTNADIPQRFGESSFSQFHPGESYLKVRYSGWNLGASTQRMMIGPAVTHPLLFSYNAPGFPHLFTGTESPKQIFGGLAEGRIFWGLLQESDYFDEDESNNRRYITGFTLRYSPDFVKGLSIGIVRTAVSFLPDGGLAPGDLFMAFSRRQPTNDDIDPDRARFIKSSVFARYHLPKSGVEAYAEWGRNDNRRSLRDFLAEPELNRGYVIGFIKRFHAGTGRRIVTNIELTNLENSSVSSQSRDFNIWYTHPVIRQGFTNRGQVIGSSIGPGSSNQMINISYYEKRGMLGVTLGRQVHHNDRLFKHREFYESTLPAPWMTIRFIHEVEIYYGFQLLLFLPRQFELQANYRFGKIENRHNRFDTRNGKEVFFDEINRHFSLTLRYRINQWLR